MHAFSAPKMVRQVISIHTGQAGVRSGAAFWELLLDEQGFTNEGFLRSPGFGGPLGAPLGAPIGDFIWDSPLQRASLGGPWGPLGGMGGPPGAPEAAERVQNAADCFFAETEAGRRVPRWVCCCCLSHAKCLLLSLLHSAPA